MDRLLVLYRFITACKVFMPRPFGLVAVGFESLHTCPLDGTKN